MAAKSDATNLAFQERFRNKMSIMDREGNFSKGAGIKPISKQIDSSNGYHGGPFRTSHSEGYVRTPKDSTGGGGGGNPSVYRAGIGQSIVGTRGGTDADSVYQGGNDFNGGYQGSTRGSGGKYGSKFSQYTRDDFTETQTSQFSRKSVANSVISRSVENSIRSDADHGRDAGVSVDNGRNIKMRAGGNRSGALANNLQNGTPTNRNMLNYGIGNNNFNVSTADMTNNLTHVNVQSPTSGNPTNGKNFFPRNGQGPTRVHPSGSTGSILPNHSGAHWSQNGEMAQNGSLYTNNPYPGMANGYNVPNHGAHSLPGSYDGVNDPQSVYKQGYRPQGSRGNESVTSVATDMNGRYRSQSLKQNTKTRRDPQAANNGGGGYARKNSKRGTNSAPKYPRKETNTLTRKTSMQSETGNTMSNGNFRNGIPGGNGNAIINSGDPNGNPNLQAFYQQQMTAMNGMMVNPNMMMMMGGGGTGYPGAYGLNGHIPGGPMRIHHGGVSAGNPVDNDSYPDETRSYAGPMKDKKYKPYTLRDFRELQASKNIKLGGLGPNTNTEEWKRQRDKRNKMEEFSKNIRVVNRNTHLERQPTLTSEERSPVGGWPTNGKSSRDKALDYAKNIPLPRKESRRSSSRKGLYQDDVDFSNAYEDNSNELDYLDMNRERFQNQVERIRTDFRQL
eukprot:CAMPEP_0114981958 /NCGR_PEP_ID=MMETSP0216-20121206/5830_1 /TAXON_ID=223996 /ORGANISM="Protocruzia adherens, Strain Boccale" /LENGTH=671 /DNA_ID=CAMNT_0002343681 /DNA_START=43 /DNA_END=2058 /DNA_ORIENTATION=-